MIHSFDDKNSSRRLVLETGAIYEGDLVNGIRTGKGRQTWPDGNLKCIHRFLL